jgi:hypothetical protein
VNHIIVNDGGTLDAPALTEVRQSIDVRGNGTLRVPSLRSTYVELFVCEGATLIAPQLETTGNVLIRERVTLSLPRLKSVANLRLLNDARLDVPHLKDVGFSLQLFRNSTLIAPTLISARSLDLSPGARFDAPNFSTLNGQTLATGSVARERLRAVAAAALATPQSLEMTRWHSCDTTHCIAGWAITLASADERAVLKGTDVPSTATILLGIAAAPLFYLTNDEARERLQLVLDDV